MSRFYDNRIVPVLQQCLRPFGYGMVTRFHGGWRIVRAWFVGALMVHREVTQDGKEAYCVGMATGIGFTSFAFSKRDAAMEAAEEMWESLSEEVQQVMQRGNFAEIMSVRSQLYRPVARVSAEADVHITYDEAVSQ